MKSAIEIALEKTKDIEPQEPPKELPEEAKEKIRQINKEYDARVAEVETKVSSKIREMIQQYGPEEVKAHMPDFQAQLRQERDRINSERRQKTDAVEKEYLGEKSTTD